jgi:hypothetical protein
MDQLVQILGSLLVLTAFAAALRGTLSTESRAYLALNLIGSVVLAVLAAHEHQWGFPAAGSRLGAGVGVEPDPGDAFPRKHLDRRLRVCYARPTRRAPGRRTGVQVRTESARLRGSCLAALAAGRLLLRGVAAAAAA